MPSAIERNVLKQNVEFMHVRSHFSPEYFQFVKKLVGTNHHLMPATVSVEPLVSLNKKVFSAFDIAQALKLYVLTKFCRAKR